MVVFSNAATANDAVDPALLEFIGALEAAESAGIDVDQLIDDRLHARRRFISQDELKVGSGDDQSIERMNESEVN